MTRHHTGRYTHTHRQHTATYQTDKASRLRKVVIALARRTTPEDGQIIMTETCRVF